MAGNHGEADGAHAFAEDAERRNTGPMKKLAAVGLAILVLAGAGAWLRGQGLWPGGQGVWPERLTAWVERNEPAWATGWLDQATASPAPVHYVTAPIERGDIRQTVTATGTLNAVVTVRCGMPPSASRRASSLPSWGRPAPASRP
jgi:hypothetical protein